MMRGRVQVAYVLGLGLLWSALAFEPAQAQSLLCSVTSIVTGQNSTACGAQSLITGDYGLASGYLSSVTGNNSAAVGAYSLAGGNNAVALGAHATAANAFPYLGISNATALGAYANAGVGGLASGAFSNATGQNATALGLNATASAAGSVAIGSGSVATIANTVSIGSSGNERRLLNVAAGTISATSTDAVNGSQLAALSATVSANSTDILAHTTAITMINGRFALSNVQVAAGLGGGATVNGNGYISAPNYTVLGGSYNNVGGALAAISARVENNSTAINAIGTGNGSSGLVIQDPATKVISIGSTAQGSTLNIGGSDGTRTLTGVAAGALSSSSSEAVTGAQLFTTNNAVAAQTARFNSTSTAIASAFGGGAQFQSNGTFVNPSYAVSGSTYTSVGAAIQAMDAALAATRSTTIQNTNAITQNTNAISQISSNTTNNATTRLRYASINGTGNDANASGQNAVAFGSGSKSSGSSSVAIGNDSVASRDNSIAVGNSSRATGVNAIAIGMGAVATGSVAVGVGAQAANGGAALGDESIATGTDSAALGPKSRATARNAVAIGAGSVATEENIVSVGAQGAERRITNVAAGVNQTDAVNMSQLNDVSSRFTSSIARLDSDMSKVRGGVAMAMAMSGGALPGDARVGVSVNVGTYGGQTALGVSHYVRLNNAVVLSGSVGLQDRQIGGRAGIMAAW